MSKQTRANLSLISLALVLLLALGGAAGFSLWYNTSLRPVAAAGQPRLFTVDEGSSAQQIATGLQNLRLIRNARAFTWYVKSKSWRNKLQAGTYKFSPTMSAQVIAHKLATGDVDKNWLTILPAKRLDQIKLEFISSGYKSSEVNSAFKVSNYRDVPLVANLPKGANLEGFLFPDSFQKTTTTPASVIVRESLAEMQDHLSSNIVKGFARQKLTIFQGVTLASIVAQESGSQASQPIVAQVFLSRLRQGMALGSDVTAFYASAIAGQSPSVQINSPYNTRINKGLPPGPIGNVTASALTAVAHPAKTNYLYFVAGDDGVLHFSHTESEHEAAISKYCKKLCQ